MEQREKQGYEFGDFRLDVRRRTLSRGGRDVPVVSRYFDLLLYLVENNGRVLEHEEILNRVWSGTIVEQATLKKGISTLRQLLEQDPESSFIKTVPRRGYSFVSPVRTIEETPPTYVHETEREVVVEEYEVFEDDPAIAVGHHISSGRAFTTGAKQKSRWRWFALAGVAAVVLLAAIFGVRYYLSRRPPLRFAADRVRIIRLTNNGSILSGATISADGNYILYPSLDPDGVVLWLRQTNANSARKLTAPARGSFWSYSFAPDNSYVYYVFHDTTEPEKSGLYRVPLLEGDGVRLAQNVASASVAPDNKRILISHTGNDPRLSTIDLNGGDEKPVRSFPSGTQLWSITWSPGGTSLLCTLNDFVDDKPRYYVSEFSLADGHETPVLPPGERIIYGAAWLPDRSALLLGIREPNADLRQIWQYTPPTDEWVRVTNDDNSYKFFQLTRDGSELVSTQERLAATISTVTAESGVLPIQRNAPLATERFRPVNNATAAFSGIAWTGDGRLIYAVTENRQESIFAMGANGADPRSLTEGKDGIWLAPAVTGDGQRVTLLSSRDGRRQGWSVGLDGKNLLKLPVTDFPLAKVHVLRDNTIVYSYFRGGTPLLRARTSDGQIRELTDSDTGNWAVSPDEKLLAVERLDPQTHRYATELRTLSDGRIVRTFAFVSQHRLCFTTDGKALAYDDMRAEVGQILVQPLEGGDPFPLTNFPGDRIFDFAFSADGRRLAVIRGRTVADAVLIKAGDR